MCICRTISICLYNSNMHVTCMHVHCMIIHIYKVSTGIVNIVHFPSYSHTGIDRFIHLHVKNVVTLGGSLHLVSG